jgi:hypothetical protein
VKSKEKLCGFHLSIAFDSLGFNDHKALNLLGRIMIRGFAVGRKQHRRWRYELQYDNWHERNVIKRIFLTPRLTELRCTRIDRCYGRFRLP